MQQAAMRPDAVAVVMGEERLTYGELDRRSNQLARLLVDHGCAPGDRVCLVADKSIGAIVGMIGTLKANCAYVPIDLKSPPPRLRMIFDSAEPRLVLTTAAAIPLAEELIRTRAVAPDTPIGSLDPAFVGGDILETAFSLSDCDEQSAETPRTQSSSGDLAHILFTSGSTGTPKGVMITHGNVIAFISWATKYFETSSDDRISGHPPLHFDLSTFDIYATFLAGAELHLVPAEASLFPHTLAELVRGSALTQWFAVPSILTYMAKFDVIRRDDFPSLKRVIWCGDVLPTPILIHWMERLPHAAFTNLYGPTETTIASSYYTVPGVPDEMTAAIPIGAPCGGEELLVLDGNRRSVSVAETGELYIGGTGLSPGYWRDVAKTREAFIPDPRDPEARIYRTGDLARLDKDDVVYFVGRSDSQIKHRGYRIELLEVEAAVRALPEIRECAVVSIESGGFEGTTICCAYAAADGSVRPRGLRARLGRSLPAYMLPSRWLEFESLPKNVNGKIDRRLLKESFSASAGDAPPEVHGTSKGRRRAVGP